MQVARALERDGLLNRARRALAGRRRARRPSGCASWHGRDSKTPCGGSSSASRTRTSQLLALLAPLGRPAPARLLARCREVALDDVMRVLRGLARSDLVSHVAEGFRAAHDVVGESIQAAWTRSSAPDCTTGLAAALTQTDGPQTSLPGTSTAPATRRAAAAATRPRPALDGRFADDEAHQLACRRAGARRRQATCGGRCSRCGPRPRSCKATWPSARDDLRAALTEAPPGRFEPPPDPTRPAHRRCRGPDACDGARRPRPRRGREGPGGPGTALYVRALVGMTIEPRRCPRSASTRHSRCSPNSAIRRHGRHPRRTGHVDVRFRRHHDCDRTSWTGLRAVHRQRQSVAGGDPSVRLRTRPWRSPGRPTRGRPHERRPRTRPNLGYAEGEAMVLWQHSGVLVGCGRLEEAGAAAARGRGLAKRIGHRGWTAGTLEGVRCRPRGSLRRPGRCRGRARRERPTSGEHLSMFTSGPERTSRCAACPGPFDEAADDVSQALDVPGDRPVRRPARAVRMAVARGDADALELVVEALQLARTGGHLLSAARLEELRGHCPPADPDFRADLEIEPAS